MSYELLLARRRILMASNRVWPTLLYISEAEVSMCCKDGTDGKGGTYQLTAVFSDGLTHSATWTTSDASKATVDSSGLVSFSSATSFGDVTISCSYRGVTKTCLLTVYATMPSAETEGSGLWLCKGGKTGVVSFTFGGYGYDDLLEVDDLRSSLIIAKTYRIGGGVGPVTRLYGPVQSTFFDIGATDGSIRVSKTNQTLTSRIQNEYTTSSGKIPRNSSFFMTLFYDGASLYLNHIAQSLSFLSTITTDERVGRIIGDFTLGRAEKTIIIASSEYGKTLSDMRPLVGNKISHCFQNYIRYTDRTVGGTSRLNYTEIPNIGTLGSSFDLSCNNVPSAWFGV